MTRAEKAARIQAILAELFPQAPIPLAHQDPFTLLVAVLLSAQCTDARVNLVTPRLFARASTPAAMAPLPERTIRALIRSCGLGPAKAKAIKALSRILVEQHGGTVPDDLAALEALPGVGHKTASVVMAQAFGQPAFPVDTHIHRLAARWGLSDGHSVVRTERDLKRSFPPAAWNTLHLQIIYFGRQYCPARRHDLSSCPICSWAAPKARTRARVGRPPSRSARQFGPGGGRAPRDHGRAKARPYTTRRCRGRPWAARRRARGAPGTRYPEPTPRRRTARRPPGAPRS